MAVKKTGYQMDATVEGGNKGKMRISSARRMGVFARFLITTGVVIVILMITFVFVARTEGFRDLLQSALSTRLGLELEIEKTGVGLPYVIVVENIASKDVGSEKAGWIIADEARIGLGFRTPLVINVTRASLNLVEGLNGEWSPALFSRLGDLPLRNVSEISHITESFRKNTALHLKDCSINWVPARDKGVSASGISFEVMPVRMPGKGMFYHRLLVYNVPGGGDHRFKDVERVWLACEDNRYVELERSKGRVPDYALEFWEKDHFKKFEDDEILLQEGPAAAEAEAGRRKGLKE